MGTESKHTNVRPGREPADDKWAERVPPPSGEAVLPGGHSPWDNLTPDELRVIEVIRATPWGEVIAQMKGGVITIIARKEAIKPAYP